MWSLDPQTGHLCDDRGALRVVDPVGMGLLYWTAMGVPDSRIASSYGCTGSEVQQHRERLNSLLGGDGTSLERGLRLTNGWGPCPSEPWRLRTASTLIDRGLARSDDRPFVFDAGSGALTAAEVADLVARLRAGLRQAGIPARAWIAVDATQRLESYLMVLATLLRGGVVVRLGETLPLGAVQDAVESLRGHLPPVVLSNRPVAMDERGPGLRLALDEHTGALSFGDWLAGCPEPESVDHLAATVAPTDPALVGFTSGSTGRPKLVITSHEAVWRSTEVALRIFGLGAADVFYSATDITALSAFRSLVSLPLLSGGSVVLPGKAARASPLESALECEAYGVTRLTAVPNVLRGILRAGDGATAVPLTSLRTVFSGSGVLDRATSDAFRARYGVPVVDYFGQREIGTALYSDPDGPGTIGDGGGQAAEVLVRVLDGNGRPVPDGEVGEVVVLTDCHMLQAPGSADVHRPTINLGAPACTVADHPGWHATGDLGRVQPDRRVEVVGRRRDIIKAADGTLVFPLEVETVLGRSPCVREASAFAIIDSAGVERVAAAAIRSDHAPDIPDAALEAELRKSVVQASGVHVAPVRILFLTDFPRVAQRKPDRSALAALFRNAFP